MKKFQLMICTALLVITSNGMAPSENTELYPFAQENPPDKNCCETSCKVIALYSKSIYKKLCDLFCCCDSYQNKKHQEFDQYEAPTDI